MLLGTLIACSSSSSSSLGGDIFNSAKAREGNVVVTVNGTEIHEGLLKLLGELNPRLESQLANPMTRKKILSSLVDQQLLYQEALKRSLDKDENVLLKSLLNRHVIISNALLEKQLDTAMKKEYDAKKDEQFTKVSLAQIAVNFLPEPAAKENKDKDKKTEATAEQKKAALAKIKAIKARLDKEDFAKVAQDVSDDATSKKKGGSLGEISKDDKRIARLGLKNLIPPAFTLKKDQVSDPIETEKGYSLIKVTSDPTVTAFEDAKKVLGFQLQSTVKTDLISELKKSAKIEYAKTDKVEKIEGVKAPDGKTKTPEDQKAVTTQKTSSAPKTKTP
jgi:parvulin-like peptidyl-prolyl isomerase